VSSCLLATTTPQKERECAFLYQKSPEKRVGFVSSKKKEDLPTKSVRGRLQSAEEKKDGIIINRPLARAMEGGETGKRSDALKKKMQ